MFRDVWKPLAHSATAGASLGSASMTVKSYSPAAAPAPAASSGPPSHRSTEPRWMAE
jgi:hypothetical protein